ncbi:MAG: homoserine kinase [Bdellovibrionota bacterium]
MVKVFAPATIGNVGPGFDVLGMAFSSMGDIITVELTGNNSYIDSIVGRDAQKIPMDAKKNCAIIAAEAMLRNKGINKGVKISIEKSLPVAGGLGASAASCVGGAMGAAAAANLEVSNEEIMIAALEGEEKVAGRHLDNIAPCLFGGFTLVLSEAPPQVYSLPFKNDWWVCIFTPKCEIETKKAREVLPKQLTTKTWVNQMRNAIGLVSAFSLGDVNLARASLVDYFSEPYRSHLIDDFGIIKNIMSDNNAIGSSISGSGPTIFALFEKKAQAESCKTSLENQFPKQSSSICIGEAATKGAYIL